MTARAPTIRRHGLDDLPLIGRIDRSEHVDIEFTASEGRIVERPVTMAEVPPWDPIGTGPYSVAAQIAFCEPVVRRGACFLGAWDGDELLGVAVADPRFEESAGWLAFLHVSRPHRRRGAASALWRVAVEAVAASGARRMYVSAVPTGSAVGFYLSRGCRLADPPHPTLLAMEPDDVHLVLDLGEEAPERRPG